MMIRKLFPSDKNYILQKVQEKTRAYLLVYLVEYAKEFYLQYHNPLGLIDKTILKIQNSNDYPLENLSEFYHSLAGIYRYKFGEVQLEFLFDGGTHEEKYDTEWVEYFKENIKKYCYNAHFLKAVLAITVFYPKDKTASLAGNRMKHFIEQYFNLKIYKHRGIQKLKAS